MILQLILKETLFVKQKFNKEGIFYAEMKHKKFF